MLRRFIAEELPRLRLNVRDSNGLYKFTTNALRRYLARHLGEDKAYGALIAIVTGHLMAELVRNGYEIVYRRKARTSSGGFVAMASDDVLTQIKEYVDKRLEEFRDELLDYLDSVKARDLEKVRRELVRLLVREVEDLRRQLLSEVGSRNDIDVIARRLDELSREINELRQLISNQPSVVDFVRREVEGVERRLRWLVIDKINEVETRRRRSSAKKAVILLLALPLA
ncbi:hypothetical protein [Vulcanisaeta distributa]|uniref:hypothetical protein n=1 Tax=Vulcanisaeta distributa TaxID=164451 RepID=UPI0006CFBD89|nr:hypothetical protein [Vulcanisaeta distributa]